MDSPGRGTATDQSAIFVNQLSRTGQIGPIASWITLAGWANAAQLRYGRAWVVTTDGVLSPPEALARASRPARPSSAVSSWRRRIPEPVITLAKDVRRIRENRRFRAHFSSPPWDTTSVRMVMTLHGLGFDAGLRLAESLGVPSVLVVDACQVQEARAWGVRRPGWGGLAERLGERPQLRRADVVVSVSDEVAASVARLSGRCDRVVVIPNGVDTDLFAPDPADDGLRARLGLDGRFVVGWSGSFRTFHGLGTLLDAVALLRRDAPEVSLLLVGDGLGRPSLEQRARELGLPLILPGTVPYREMPAYLRLMDVAVALAPNATGFHYSPVKLREYQACGVPVVASAAGEMARALHDGDDALLVEPGDVKALATALAAIADDPSAARERARRARASVVATGSWTGRLVELERMVPTAAGG